MARTLVSCKINGLRVAEVHIQALMGKVDCKIGLEIDGRAAAQTELQNIHTLPGVAEALEVFLDSVEEAAAAHYGKTEETAVAELQEPLPGLGGGI